MYVRVILWREEGFLILKKKLKTYIGGTGRR
jgi:hypothetical protein